MIFRSMLLTLRLSQGSYVPNTLVTVMTPNNMPRLRDKKETETKARIIKDLRFVDVISRPRNILILTIMTLSAGADLEWNSLGNLTTGDPSVFNWLVERLD